MGYRLAKFSVTPEENEQINAIIKVPNETRSIINGVVLDECNKPKKDAVVKLLKITCHNNIKHLEPITHTFTDESGQFLFGPLCPHVTYVIKVWINNVKTREIVIKSDDCSEEDDCHRNNSNNKYNSEDENEDEDQYQHKMTKIFEDE